MFFMIIAHNMLANNAIRQSDITGKRKTKATERLASGYRINRAADDAAGLSISEKMRGQIRGLTRASQNVQDGISFIQTGDGALEEVQSMLQRIRELAVQASNDTNTAEDREAINKEVQALKKETNRIFNDVDFNTIQIFRAPYVPDVEGVPNDYELFNTEDGKPAAGVLINHKRYNWEELGVPTTPQSTDWETQFTDGNGELIYLKLKAGDPPQNIHRVYKFQADEEGIKINDLPAARWDSTITLSDNTYSFPYRGMNISFEVDPDDTRQDIINKLNLDGLTLDGLPYNSWDAIPSGGGTNYAVTSSQDSMTFNVTNSNKNNISTWTYSLEADDEGVQLVQTSGNDGLNHTKTNWENFTNTNSGEAFPLSDWGTEAEGSNPVTLSSASGASYKYDDQASAGYLVDGLDVNFSFPLDETSKQQAIDGLTSDLQGARVSSPIRTITLSDNNVSIDRYSGFNSFEFQRDDLLRNFGVNGSDSNINLKIERKMIKIDTIDDYEYRKDLYQAYAKLNTTVQKYTITKYGDLQNVVFLDENHVQLSEPPEDYIYPPTPSTETSLYSSDTTASYKANTGLDPSYFNQTSNTGEYSDAGSKMITKSFTYQEEGETKTGYVQLTYAISQATKTVTTKRYETSSGNLVNYTPNSSYTGGYRRVNSSSYYVLTSEEGSSKDTSNRGYRSANSSDTNTQRYVSDNSRWVKARTFNVYQYAYSAKNSNNTEIMGSASGSFINTSTTDRATSDSTLVLHNQFGTAFTRDTENHSKLLDTTLTTTGSNYASLSLSYDADVRNNTTTATITPDGKATRTFTHLAKSGGTATNTSLTVKVNPPEKVLHIQAGANSEQNIDIRWPGLSNSIIGISGARFDTAEASQATITMADNAIGMVSEVRSQFGAYQNRLEHTHNVNDNTAENLQYAESRIRDADMAKEMMAYSQSQILNDAALSMVSQANQSTQGIMKLLQ